MARRNGGTVSDVLLLLSGRDRALVADWLASTDGYRVVDAEPADVGSADVDICILDPETLLENEAALREWKADEHPVFLPYLLVIPESQRRRLVSDSSVLPPPFDVVDDVVSVPVARPVFAQRIASLVRIHEQSVALGNSERRFRAFVEQSLSGVFVAKDGTFEYVNDRLGELVGIDPDSTVGQSVATIAARVDQDRLAADARRFQAGEIDSLRGTYEGTRSDGTTVHFVVEATRVDLVEDDVTVGVVVDITDQVEAERRAVVRAEELSLLNRIVRHDIRNDLNVILGWAETLREHVDEDGQASLDRVIRTSRHIHDLTDAVRDIATLVEAEGELSLETIDAAAVLRQEVEMTLAQYDDDGRSVTVRGVESLPDHVPVRANDMLSSVFGNLLNNAVLHATADAVTIDVAIEVGEQWAVVTVADDGPGIPDAAKERVFGRGERGLDSSGSGLGLYLVDRLVTGYGGDVRVEDNEPTGARFTVSLPRADSGE